MRAFDPRHWRIAPLALTVACGPTTIPVGEDGTETGTTESSETDSETGDGDPTTDTDSDTDNENPCADVDCPPYHYCDYGTCWHDGSCGETEDCPGDPGDLECLDGFCHEPEDPGCESDADCGPYEECRYQACVIPCDPPQMVEIPLPDGVQGAVLSLQFADVVGDGGKELVLLRAGEVLVVDGDVVTSSAVPAPGGEALLMVEGNDDVAIDVVLRSSVASQSRLLLGDGQGQFGFAIDWNVPGLSSVDVIDWPPGGLRELLVQRSDDGSVGVLSNLSSTDPTFTPLPFSLGGIDRIASGRLADGVTSSEAVAFSDCVFEVQLQQGNPLMGGIPPLSACIVSVGDYLPSYVEDEILTVSNNGMTSSIRLYPGLSLLEFTSMVAGVYGGVDLARGTGIVLIGAGPPMRVGPLSFDCKNLLNPMPPASQIAVGDVDGDDLHDEIALVDELGGVSLWRNAALD